jgi:hypothetical protein
MKPMFITDLLLAYASWLFASVMFFWLGSVLYRTTRNTFFPASENAADGVAAPVPSVVHTPARPIRKPRVPLTPAA